MCFGYKNANTKAAEITLNIFAADAFETLNSFAKFFIIFVLNNIFEWNHFEASGESVFPKTLESFIKPNLFAPN